MSCGTTIGIVGLLDSHCQCSHTSTLDRVGKDNVEGTVLLNVDKGAPILTVRSHSFVMVGRQFVGLEGLRGPW